MPVAVDIILPCFNPNDSWPVELIGFYTFIKDRHSVNFIVVNDGSVGEKIQRQVDELKKQNIPLNFVSYPKNMGKGYALRQGVAVSKSDFVVYTDIDFPFTNQSMGALIEDLLQKNDDVLAGYRDQRYYRKKMSGFRKTLSKAFRFFIKDILKMPVTDTQCGLKGFNKKGKVKFLATTINRYLFDFEFIYTSCKDKSLSVGTIQVQLKDNVVFSKMRLKIIMQESFNLLSVLLFRKN